MNSARLARSLIFAPVLLLAAAAGWAHHSISAQFDLFKAMDLQGVLSRVEWINPHGYLYLDVKDADGTVHTWALEAPPPSGWRRAGVATKDYFPIGQNYTVKIAPPRNNTKTGLVIGITTPEGKHISVLGQQGISNAQ